jgi:hypothetical protein
MSMRDDILYLGLNVAKYYDNVMPFRWATRVVVGCNVFALHVVDFPVLPQDYWNHMDEHNRDVNRRLKLLLRKALG